MAGKEVCVLLTLVIVATCVRPCLFLPQPDADHPYIEQLEVSNFFLYKLTFADGYNSDVFTDDGLRSVLIEILSKHGMSLAKINVPVVLKTLSTKIRWMYRKWQGG